MSSPHIYELLSRRKELTDLFVAQKLRPNLQASHQEKQTGTIEDYLDWGMDKDFSDNLAHVLYDLPESVVASWTMNAVVSPYSMLIWNIPHRGHTATHTFDEMSPHVYQAFLDGVERTTRAILSVAEARNEPIRHVYINQHIGPQENDHQRDYGTSMRPTHWHVIALPERLCNQGESQQFFNNPKYWGIRWDPTIVIANDIFKERFSDLDSCEMGILKDCMPFLRGQFPQEYHDQFRSSIILSETAITASILPHERTLMRRLMSVWKAEWNLIASCFTDFQTDQHNRFIPVSEEERMQRVAEYLSTRSLSREAQKVMFWLAGKLRNARGTNKGIGKDLFKGISGQLLIHIDYGTGIRKIQFAPRSFTLSDKTWCASDGDWYGIKDRSQTVSDTERDAILEIQRDITGAIKENKTTLRYLM